MKIEWPESGPGVSVDITTPRTVWPPSAYARLFGRHIYDQAPFLKGRRALDVGSGSGVLAVLMAKLGATVTAVDVNPAAVSCTLENAKRNDVSIECLESDGLAEVLEWPTKREGFDFVVCNPFSTPGDDVFGTDNGPDGRRLLDHVLEKAPHVMRRAGKLLICSNAESGQERTNELLERHWREHEVLDADVFPMESPIFSEEWKQRWLEAGRIFKRGDKFFHTAEFILARR